MDKKLKEALSLIGGKVVIKDGGEYYVLLTLDEFKKISQNDVEDLTKQELIDKINVDIASWKHVQEKKELEKIDLDKFQDSKDEEIRYEKP